MKYVFIGWLIIDAIVLLVTCMTCGVTFTMDINAPKITDEEYNKALSAYHKQKRIFNVSLLVFLIFKGVNV